ncbi:MAG: ATP-binding protein [Gemmatimonadota bacterium]|nr:ATP-binding protein [Gemmatimonadota bacterium]
MTSPLRLTVRRSPTNAGETGPIRVRLDLPNDLGCVEEAVELLALHCFAGRSPSPRTAFRLRVTLAEAMANAIQAAVRAGGARQVCIVANLHADVVRLSVSDQGEGFDPAAPPDPTLPEALDREAGRGLFLIRHLADRVEFNDQGNTIWMTLPRS